MPRPQTSPPRSLQFRSGIRQYRQRRQQRQRSQPRHPPRPLTAAILAAALVALDTGVRGTTAAPWMKPQPSARQSRACCRRQIALNAQPRRRQRRCRRSRPYATTAAKASCSLLNTFNHWRSSPTFILSQPFPRSLLRSLKTEAATRRKICRAPAASQATQPLISTSTSHAFQDVNIASH